MGLKKKIAILACLSSLDPKYSIAGVVADQLQLLSDMGEDVVFITTDDFKDQELVPKNVLIRYYKRYEGSLDEIDKITFEKYVFDTSAILKTHLSDRTVCIQHDLLFLDGFLPLNWSVRKTGEMLPKLKWLHWMHSGPSQRKELPYPWSGLYMDMPNSEFVYLNHTDIPKLAAMYKIPENKIRIVHNFLNPDKLFKFHPVTSELVRKYDLYSADTICIYPIRLDKAKQPEKIIKLFEKLKESQTVRLVICNSWSNAQKEQDYMQELRSASSLSDSELIFTSEFDSEWCKSNDHAINLGVPREVVTDLMRIADLFILPSISEACSMIMLEAALNKNLMILNDDLYSLHEWGGQKMDGNTSSKAMYLSFGSITRPIANYAPSEDAWFAESAKAIELYQVTNQASNFFRATRKRHTPKWVYENQLKPLL